VSPALPLAAATGEAVPGPAILLPLIALCVVSFAYYIRLARSVFSAPPDDAASSRWDIGDAVFAGSLAGLYLSTIFLAVDHPQELTMDAILGGMVLHFLLVGGILLFLTLRGKNPLAMFGLLRGQWWQIGAFSLVSLAAAYPVIYLSQIASYWFLNAAETPQEIIRFLETHAGFGDRAAVVVLAVIVAPIAEELIFRGYFYGVLRQYGGRLCAILVTSMLFAAIHLHAPSMAGLFFLAVTLALIYEKTSNLWAPIFAHAVFNGVAICLAVYWPGISR